MKGISLALLVAVAMSSCADGGLYRLTIQSTRLSVEVVDTDETRARGLMFRESLPETQGMLFVFDEAAPRAFYMRNTSVPLSIAYIDERLVIREIYDMDPFSLENVLSRNPAMYALEVNQGAFERWSISAGDRLVLSDPLSDRIGK